MSGLLHLFKGLQQVAARDGQGDVYMVHDEERLLLALVWKTSKVVCDKQEHVYVRLLQKEKKCRAWSKVSTWYKITVQYYPIWVQMLIHKKVTVYSEIRKDVIL